MDSMNPARLFAWVLPIALCACAAPPSSPIPAALHPDASQSKAFSLLGKGVQIYRCQTDSAGSPRWSFVAPSARLFDSSGAQVGTHGAGPFWQADDGSRIVGKLEESAAAPTAGAIPWLLLSAQAAPTPGRFLAITSVQRIDTIGGVMPATGCDGPADQGHQVDVPYSANYVFFVKR